MTLRSLVGGLTAALVTLSLGGAALAKRGDNLTDEDRTSLMEAQKSKASAKQTRNPATKKKLKDQAAKETAGPRDKVLGNLNKKAKKPSLKSRMKRKPKAIRKAKKQPTKKPTKRK